MSGRSSSRQNSKKAAAAAAASASAQPAVKTEAPPAPAAAAAASSHAAMHDDGNESDGSESGGSAAEEAAALAEAAAAAAKPQQSNLLHQAALSLPSSSVMQQHAIVGLSGLPTTISAPTNIARFSTMGPHGATFVSPPTSFSRQVSRLPSTVGMGAGGGPTSPLGSAPASQEWRALVTVEERITMRRKLREAYSKHCRSFEQLLDTVVAVDEELLFACSGHRIDYFKSSIDWDSRIQLKRQQLTSSTSTGAANGNAAAAASPNGGKKRAADSGDESNLSGSSVSLLELGINNSDLLPPSSAGALLPPVSQLSMPPKTPSKTDSQPLKKQKSQH